MEAAAALDRDKAEKIEKARAATAKGKTLAG